MKICICGGGNVAHAMAACAATKGIDVNILTRKPREWAQKLVYSRWDGKRGIARLGTISSEPALAVGKCDYIFIVLPRFAVEEVYNSIADYIHPEQNIVIVPGNAELVDWQFNERWNRGRLAGLSRVPYISRTISYGHEVEVKGCRAFNKLWTASKGTWEQVARDLHKMFEASIQPLSSPLPFLLSNSNPLLHPSRLLTLFPVYSTDIIYTRNPLFYEEWPLEAACLYLQADNELQRICHSCPELVPGLDFCPIGEYYAAPTPHRLMQKLRGIEAFKGIRSPMICLSDDTWAPDLNSRYFTEDIPYGTRLIKNYALARDIDTPIIDYFLAWYKQFPLKKD